MLLPTQLGLIPNLRRLIRSYNQLSGPWSIEVGNISSTLNALDLSHNGFIGRLRSEQGQLTQLNYLDLSSLQMGGTIPPELGLLSQLSYLALNGMSTLTGSIPTEFGRLTWLQSLGLCLLNGSMPTELGLLSQLTSFEVLLQPGQFPTDISQYPLYSRPLELGTRSRIRATSLPKFSNCLASFILGWGNWFHSNRAGPADTPGLLALEGFVLKWHHSH